MNDMRNLKRAIAAVVALFILGSIQANAESVGTPTTTWFPTEKTQLAYQTFGSVGTTYVLLAGGPGMNPAYVAPIAARLASGGRRVVLFHQRGTGLSAPAIVDRSRMNLAGAVADVDALRVHLGKSKLNLIGHSWGGMLAMAYATRYPDRVGSLVLIDTGPMDAGQFSRAGAAMQAALKPTERTAIAVALRKGDRKQAREIYDGASFADRSNVPLLKASVGNAPLEYPNVSDLIGSSIAHIDARPGVRAMRAPVFLIFGIADPGYFIAAQIRALDPRAQLVTIQHAGHYCWLENPTASFKAIDALP
ncbi:MAG: alpha/beta hydrolase [Candidatus Baltobacteraceae bacterium]